MKKNFPIFIVLLIMSMLLVVSCSKDKKNPSDQSSLNTTEKKDQVDTDKLASKKNSSKKQKKEPVIVRSQDSAYRGINITFESYVDERMEYSYFIPEIESKDLNDQIGSWLEGEKKDFIKEAKKISEATENDWVSNFSSELTTEQIDEDEMIYSLFFQENILLAGTNSMQKNKAFTFNIKENKMYTLSDLVEISEEELEDIVFDLIKANDKLSESIDQEVLKEVLRNQDEIDFRIYGSEIHILFDAYEVASGDCGALEIALKEEDIEDYLTKDGRKLLSLIDENESDLENSEEEIEDDQSEDTDKESAEEVRPAEGDKGYIALTFDDGPHPTNTPRLLEILDDYGVKATFYILGQNAEYYPDVVSEIAKRGHELGNHSYSHPNLTNLSYWGTLEELQLNDNILLSNCGERAKTVRPPYGAIDGDVEAAVADNGQRIVTWSVDTEDWKNRDPEIILQTVIETSGPGSIILMHDIHETSVDAVPGVIEYLLAEGYQLVTVSQLP